MIKIFKKISIVLSLIVTILCISLPVFAGTTQRVIPQTIGDKENYPILQTVETTYKGILISMSDAEIPTAEKLGIDGDCEISPYTSKTEFIGLGGEWRSGLYYGASISKPVGDDSTYWISSENLDEEDAVKLIKTLKVRNVISSGELFYETYTENAKMSLWDDKAHILIICNNIIEGDTDLHTPTEDDKKLYAFNELSRNGFSVDEVCTGNSRYTSNSYIEYAVEFDKQKYKDNYWGLYEDLKSIIDEIEYKYKDDKNFNCAEIDWIMPISDSPEQIGLYNVEPVWGDATNDDSIDLYDAVEISKYIMGMVELDEDTVLLADINRDGKTNIYDAIEIAGMLIEEK